MKSASLFLSCTLLSCTLFACTDDLVITNGASSAHSAIASPALPFEILQDDELDPPSVGPETLVIRDAAEFRDKFGHDASGVRWSSEWVVYYSAGFLLSDGHVASLASLGYDADARRLDVVTRLESPGPGCDSFALPELPFVLAKFTVPELPPLNVNVEKDDTLRDCTGTPLPAEPIAPDCDVRRGGAMVTIENVHEASERFTGWFTDDVFIDEAKRLLAKGEQRVPTFKVLDHKDCDDRWDFKLDPAQASWNDFTIEVCDAIPSYIQANKDAWIASNVGWCPWGARVIDVDDRR